MGFRIMKVKMPRNAELSDALAKVTKALPDQAQQSHPGRRQDSRRKVTSSPCLPRISSSPSRKKINAEVLIEGECVVPGKLFADYAKKIEEEELELELEPRSFPSPSDISTAR